VFSLTAVLKKPSLPDIAALTVGSEAVGGIVPVPTRIVGRWKERWSKTESHDPSRHHSLPRRRHARLARAYAGQPADGGADMVPRRRAGAGAVHAGG